MVLLLLLLLLNESLRLWWRSRRIATGRSCGFIDGHLTRLICQVRHASRRHGRGRRCRLKRSRWWRSSGILAQRLTKQFLFTRALVTFNTVHQTTSFVGAFSDETMNITLQGINRFLDTRVELDASIQPVFDFVIH